MLSYSLTLSKEMKEELEALQEDFVPDDPMENRETGRDKERH